MTLAALFLLAAAPAAAPECPGGTTLEINTCMAGELADADAQLNRYYKAAVDRLNTEKSGDALIKLRNGQRAWITYRDGECGAVYDYWSEGTIRGSMGLGCRIDATRQRTHTIWSNWLTYMDSSPPILPEPAIDGSLGK